MKRLFAPIMDCGVGLHERMFRLITYIGITSTAVLLGLRWALGDDPRHLAVIATVLVVVTAAAGISIHRGRTGLGAACIAAVTVFLFMPAIFFTGGGLNGGAPLWFVFCAMYVCLTLERGVRAFFLCAFGVVSLGCYYAAFRWPGLIYPQEEAVAYLDSALSVILVCVLTAALMLFQNNLYVEQSRVEMRQREEIESLRQARSRFFSSMSHEIRTPVNTIIGLNEMILRAGVPPQAAEDARGIQGASKLLLTLIDDILELSRIESGRIEIVPVEYDTGELFSEVVDMVWARAKEKGLEFHLNIDPVLPGALRGDEARIKQVLVSLLSNALNYTQEGCVTLSVGCRPAGEGRVCVSYEVEDTGQGIKKEDIPYLFEPFRRMEERKNRGIEGAGLGLSIVRQLVGLMGGELSVNSVYDRGSTFLVSVEQEIVDGTPIDRVRLEGKLERGEEAAAYQHSFEAPDARVLIVDDNELNLEVTKKLLGDTRMQIDTASSGEECLRLAQRIRYDCILMDHMMPEMDGIQCLHALRAQLGGMCQTTPVVALTANAGEDMQRMYKREGFAGYLAKPVGGACLEDAVAGVLPREKMVLFDHAARQGREEEPLLCSGRYRQALVVTADSASDIPPKLAGQLNIDTLPYYIQTEEGRFLDRVELESDGMLAYFTINRKKASAHAPSVADYEAFFARMLAQAEHVIHITAARVADEGYDNAMAAAAAFGTVTVFDSGQTSSGVGLVAVHAAHMAARELPREAILRELGEIRERVCSTFIVNKTGALCDTGRISPTVHTMCDALMLHPVLRTWRGKPVFSAVKMGRQRRMIRSFIKYALKNQKNIDRAALIITCVGVDGDTRQAIRKQVEKRCPFTHIYTLKASPATSCGYGPGAFGLTFLRKSRQG